MAAKGKSCKSPCRACCGGRGRTPEWRPKASLANPVKRAFRQAGGDTRLVHPFSSHHYLLPANPDNKTDDNDLEAIFRAAINGSGLVEPPWEETYLTLKYLVRARRELVEKRSRLHCQIREHLQRCLPGYAVLFPDDGRWTSPVAIRVARRAATAEAIRQAGIPGVTRWLREDRGRFQSRTVEHLVARAGNAAPADPLAPLLMRIWDLPRWRIRHHHATESVRASFSTQGS